MRTGQPYWADFPPAGANPSVTDLCGACGHTRDRHAVTAPGMCLVRISGDPLSTPGMAPCPCVVGRDWRRAVYFEGAR